MNSSIGGKEIISRYLLRSRSDRVRRLSISLQDYEMQITL